MLASIVIGLLMSVVTIAIHAIGTTYWIGRLRQYARRIDGNAEGLTRLQILCSTAAALLSVHIVEVVAWAMVYLLLVGGKAFANIEQAIYFSTVTFASLGYGDIVIEGEWRLLSAIQSMVGLLVFGWSSALLFAVVQKMLQADDETTEN